jgi:hypothetical protein
VQVEFGRMEVFILPRSFLDCLGMSTVSNDQGFDDKSERDLSVLVQAPPLGAQPLDAEGDKASRPHGLLQYFGVRSAAHDAELDAIATQPSVYDKDEVAAVYLPHEKYEGLSAFDPLFRWTWREEFVSPQDLGSWS